MWNAESWKEVCPRRLVSKSPSTAGWGITLQLTGRLEGFLGYRREIQGSYFAEQLHGNPFRSPHQPVVRSPLSMCQPGHCSCTHCCQLVWPAWCLFTCVLFLLGNLSSLTIFQMASGVEDVEGYKCWNERLCSLLVRPGFQEKISIIQQCCLQNSFRLLPNNSSRFCITQCVPWMGLKDHFTMKYM